MRFDEIFLELLDLGSLPINGIDEFNQTSLRHFLRPVLPEIMVSFVPLLADWGIRGLNIRGLNDSILIDQWIKDHWIN